MDPTDTAEGDLSILQQSFTTQMLKAETLEREQLEQVVDELKAQLIEKDLRIEELQNEAVTINEAL